MTPLHTRTHVFLSATWLADQPLPVARAAAELLHALRGDETPATTRKVLDVLQSLERRCVPALALEEADGIARAIVEMPNKAEVARAADNQEINDVVRKAMRDVLQRIEQQRYTFVHGTDHQSYIPPRRFVGVADAPPADGGWADRLVRQFEREKAAYINPPASMPVIRNRAHADTPRIGDQYVYVGGKGTVYTVERLEPEIEGGMAYLRSERSCFPVHFCSMGAGRKFQRVEAKDASPKFGETWRCDRDRMPYTVTAVDLDPDGGGLVTLKCHFDGAVLCANPAHLVAGLGWERVTP